MGFAVSDICFPSRMRRPFTFRCDYGICIAYIYGTVCMCRYYDYGYTFASKGMRKELGFSLVLVNLRFL